MSQDDLALLRALAARPIGNVSPTSHPRLAALVQDGYVARTADGWLRPWGARSWKKDVGFRPGDCWDSMET